MIRSTRYVYRLIGRLSLTIALCWAIVAASMPANFATAAVSAAPERGPAAAPALQAVTTIVVDTSTDPDPGSNTDTCTYTQGAILFPDADGLCSFRRALREAAGRPQTDRPIAIEFNLDASDPGRDLQAVGTWTIVLDSANRLPPLKTDTILNKNGQVTIDGATQPLGRTGAPSIIIDMGENSIEVESTGNIIRNIAFQNGGSLMLKEDGNLIEDIWMGLTADGSQVSFRPQGFPNRMAHGGIYISSNDNVVRRNVITGSFAKAIDISMGDNNIVRNNAIGTRADGTIPTVPPAVDCQPNYSASGWYGGWGIALSGSNNTIDRNIIAGMQNVRSANDTPPIALEVFGAGHTITENIIGVDADGNEVGVCGQGLKISGPNMTVLDNLIVRSRTGFEEGEETAILTNDGSPLFDRVTVRRNIVKDGPGLIYEFGPAMPKALHQFRPARITNIDGVTLTGANGVDMEAGESHCPNCLIDLYTDDLDGIDEALTYLGQTQSDASGNWTFVMTQTLPAGTGLHTISTSTQDSVILNYSAGMSTEASKLFYPMSSVSISGPASGEVNVDQVFTITVDPPYATWPFTYTVELTDQQTPLVEQLVSNEIYLTKKWSAPGVKTINVNVVNDLGSVSTTMDIEIIGPDGTSTPEPSGTPGTSTPQPSSTPATSTPTTSTPQSTSTPATPTPQPTSTPIPTPPPGGLGGSSNVYLPLMRK
ncbi:MAG: right-handed parallel beta-helix repeat-containing protein [Caldilineaceae bacterium]|nr:right-handed parallel beta-helix repeat-containing protein [Caldilineaceae bacterium]